MSQFTEALMGKYAGRYARHKDITHKAIVEALRAAGATVQSLDGKDVPDLLVGYRGLTLLVEVKRPEAKTVSKKSGNLVKVAAGQLSEGQQRWMERWRGGPAVVVRTPEEALALLASLHANMSSPP